MTSSLIDKDLSNLEIAKTSLLKHGTTVEVLNLNLSDGANVLEVLSKKIAEFEVDALVNNAGIGFARTVEQTTLDVMGFNFRRKYQSDLHNVQSYCAANG